MRRRGRAQFGAAPVGGRTDAAEHPIRPSWIARMILALVEAVAIGLLSTQVARSAEPSASELKAAAKRGHAIDPGYEEKAIPVYFGSPADFMQKCAPPGTPTAQPFVLYIAVSASGRIEWQISIPTSPVADCMIRATSQRTLPTPRAPLILEVEMKFSGGSPTSLPDGLGGPDGPRS